MLGSLSKGGIPVVSGTTLLGPSESLLWTPPQNVYGAFNAFTVRAFDGAALSALPAVPVQVNLAPGNSVPPLVFVDPPSYVGPGGLQFFAVTIIDDETPAGNLLLTATSSNQALVPNVNIVLGGSGSDRTAQIQTAAGQTGDAIVTFTATDAGYNSGQVVAFLVITAGDQTEFVVTTTADSGPGSLRQAILDANADPGTETIRFNFPGPGPHTIQPLSPLPTITGPVVIDGYTQTGASPNTLAIGKTPC